MKPVPNWPNGLVYQTQDDIRMREFFLSEFSSRLEQDYQELNKAIRFVRVETPCLVPVSIVQQHLDAEFELFKLEDHDLYLRPESTKGTYLMFSVFFPQLKNLERNLPLCLYQLSCSFRDEKDKTFNNLRFKQFYQLEFQLAYSPSTKADYHAHAVRAVVKVLSRFFPEDKIRYEILVDDCPFYSDKTTDIYIQSWEVVAISSRKDYNFPIVEISIGIDRLVAIWQHDIKSGF